MSNPSELGHLLSRQVTTSYQQLFPYLNIAPVPSVSPFYLDNAFFTVPPNVTATEDYQTLASLKTQGERIAMEQWAASYISGTPFTPPSEGAQPVADSSTQAAYLSHPGELPPPFRLIDESQIDAHASPSDIQSFIESNPTLMAQLDQASISVWLSVIALNIQTDYELAWLDFLIALLRKVHVIQRAAQQLQKHEEISDHLLEIWWQASLNLPVAIFPLPPVSPPTGTPSSSARYYALGTLHMIQYKLSGYSLGELQKVETVLQGETRERRSRQRHLEKTQNQTQTNSRQDQGTTQQLWDKDLSSYVAQVLAERTQTTSFQDYQTNYSGAAPNTTTTGGWTIVESPTGDEGKNQQQFIRKVLDEAQVKASQTVDEMRQNRGEQELEQTEINRFQNHSDSAINGFYYWLNKKYEVIASDSQKRLLIEIDCPMLASDIDILAELQTLLNFQKPQTLAQLGISSYTDISGNLSEPSSYLNLAAQYQLPEVPPPPVSPYAVSASLKSTQAVSALNLALPPGYVLQSVSVSVQSAVAQSYTVTVADQSQQITADTTQPVTFDFSAAQGSAPTASDTQTTTPALSSEFNLAVIATPSQPQDASTPSENLSYTVSVVATLVCTEAHFSQWQYDVYQLLNRGYHTQFSTYLNQLSEIQHWLDKHCTPKTFALLKLYLIKQGMQALYLQAMSHVQSDPSYPQEKLPFYQYAEEALDWDHLNLRIITTRADDQSRMMSQLLSNLDLHLYLQNLLVADRVKLLLPVKVDYVLRFLYFLDTGKIWHGEETLTPINAPSLAIVSDYKKLLRMPDERQQTETWTMTLPTAMTVVSDEDLRDIGGHLDD
ncbi:hypothetical protein [Photobacterium sp. 1_MG-2023]|uniref:hypothetical protein n=1 Tax=Photobacterium sp. 1_MG-2023 TaxID=3062646 RepID=UPI0026E3B441|nr:hypothetical protein [Photobacterium sp. 1_MG-2023]MDO6708350.1 hypothetical protein [Photobacterium sp. 1_MG-2023]